MISIESVTKRYPGGVVAVDNLSLEIAEGELCALIGPSGCGKTTTLKMINRLIEPTSGTIRIAGENVLETDPVQLRRRIGYVMQQGGLFPHQRVGTNVAAVPRLLGWDRARIRVRVHELLELVGLDPSRYARRYPHELSGGERQRVSVARALGGDPPVLLMDEPFGAVDPITRKRLQDEFLELQLHKTVLFVTHDLEEAIRLGNRIALFRTGGVLEQFDTPEGLLARPASPFVEEFVGEDRDLQRMAITLITADDLAPVVAVLASVPIGEVPSRRDGCGEEPVIVVDSGGAVIGWLDGDAPSADERTAGEEARPVSAELDVGDPLKMGFLALIKAPGGIVTVAEGGRFLGVLTLEGVQRALQRAHAETAEPH